MSTHPSEPSEKESTLENTHRQKLLSSKDAPLPAACNDSTLKAPLSESTRTKDNRGNLTSKKLNRNSYHGPTPSTSMASTQHSKTASQPSSRLRASSFASPSSPWARRRSFLSNKMISNEKHLVYQLDSYGFSDSPTYSLSLRESQGFTWNQDLFASQNQQESSIIYDDLDEEELKTCNEKFADVFDDEEEEESEDHILGENRKHTRSTRDGGRSLSYSATNDSGVNKVEVIDINIDENDLIIGGDY